MEKMMKHYCHYKAPIGDLLLVEENGKLEQLLFPNQHEGKPIHPDWIEDKNRLTDVIRQLDAYFAGDLKAFSIQMNLIGTDFQKQVWTALSQIPYGTFTNYGQLAEEIGNPKASRAVGLANGKNPIPVIIPCHRVIGKNKTLTGFGGGLDIKEQLLELEGLNIKKGRLVD